MKLILNDLDQDDVDVLLRSLMYGQLMQENSAKSDMDIYPERREAIAEQLRSHLHRTMKLQGAIVTASTKATAAQAIQSLKPGKQ